MKKKKKLSKRELQKINAQADVRINREHDVEEYNKVVNADKLLEDAKDDILDDDILKNFEQQISSNEPVRELVQSKNIKLKTSVTDEQRMILVVLNSMYEYSRQFPGLDLSVLRDILSEFIILAPSVEGKRAEQYVEAHRSYMQSQLQQQPGNFSQLGNVKNNAING